MKTDCSKCVLALVVVGGSIAAFLATRSTAPPPSYRPQVVGLRFHHHDFRFTQLATMESPLGEWWGLQGDCAALLHQTRDEGYLAIRMGSMETVLGPLGGELDARLQLLRSGTECWATAFDVYDLDFGIPVDRFPRTLYSSCLRPARERTELFARLRALLDERAVLPPLTASAAAADQDALQRIPRRLVERVAADHPDWSYLLHGSESVPAAPLVSRVREIWFAPPGRLDVMFVLCVSPRAAEEHHRTLALIAPDPDDPDERHLLRRGALSCEFHCPAALAAEALRLIESALGAE